MELFLKTWYTKDGILLNAARCAKCGDVLVSKTRHDFKFCKCGSIAVDGGTDYLKRNYKEPGDLIDLSLYVKAGEIVTSNA